MTRWMLSLRHRLRGQARLPRAWSLAAAAGLAWGAACGGLHGAFAAAAPSVAGSPGQPGPDPQQVRRGYRVYHAHCYRCHGIDAVAGVLAPDLRRSIEAMSREEFVGATETGRSAKGMPGFARLLSADEVASLYIYLRARASGVVKSGRPDDS